MGHHLSCSFFGLWPHSTYGLRHLGIGWWCNVVNGEDGDDGEDDESDHGENCKVVVVLMTLVVKI